MPRLFGVVSMIFSYSKPQAHNQIPGIRTNKRLKDGLVLLV